MSLLVLETGQHLQPVRAAAASAGLKTTIGDEWSIMWSYRTPWASDVLKRRIKKNRVHEGFGYPFFVNHLPGTLRLASKAHLPAFVRSAGLDTAVPASYLVPEQIEAARDAIISSGGLRDAKGLPACAHAHHTHTRLKPM